MSTIVLNMPTEENILTSEQRVLRRAEVAQIAQKLQDRLAIASLKSQNGWEDLSFHVLEPSLTKRLNVNARASYDDESDSDSTHSFPAPSSPLTVPLFSDDLPDVLRSGHRQRFKDVPLFTKPQKSRKRALSGSNPVFAPPAKIARTGWKEKHQLPASSPLKPAPKPARALKAPYTRDMAASIVSSPSFNRYKSVDENTTRGRSSTRSSFRFGSNSAAMIASSPPRTPSPPRNRRMAPAEDEDNKDGESTVTNNRRGEDGADLLLYLANSPSPANPSRKLTNRNRNLPSTSVPPSTPPSQHAALPSSMMTTPGGSNALLNNIGTPGQLFNFADFVNVTPSPAQKTWRTPGTAKTSSAAREAARRRLNFDALLPPSPEMGSASLMHKRPNEGLALQLGGDFHS